MDIDAARVELRIRLGDDHLVLGHRLGQWCGHAPMLEEELALANMGLDLLGQARALYSAAGAIEGRGRGEDELAFLRSDREYRNLLLVERPNGDFAHTMARQFYFAVFMHAYWQQALASADAELAGIAASAVKEVSYHVRHCAEWVIRLGDGTPESAQRMAAAIDALHPYCAEMFDADTVCTQLAGASLAPDPSALEAGWASEVATVFAAAKLQVPEQDWALRGGREGRHGEEFGHLLSELQYMQRAYPGQTW